MSLSIPSLKFLLDENVRRDLFSFLVVKGMDVKCVQQGASDCMIADASMKEGRILITNDSDFALYKKKNIYGVVWLRLPQNDSELLTQSFTRLLESGEIREGCLTTLTRTSWHHTLLDE